MLAEMFLHPTVFDHIATTAASSEDGICPEIALIEKIAASGTEPTQASGEEDAAPEAANIWRRVHVRGECQGGDCSDPPAMKERNCSKARQRATGSSERNSRTVRV